MRGWPLPKWGNFLVHHLRWTEDQLADYLRKQGVAGQGNSIDVSRPPFALPAAVTLDLPYPPSVNRIWKHASTAMTKGKVYLAPSYVKWRKAAEKQLFVTPGWSTRRIVGAFAATIALAPPVKHPRGDLDNRIKAVLDFLQQSSIVKNDRDCEALSVFWASQEAAPLGCRVTVTPC